VRHACVTIAILALPALAYAETPLPLSGHWQASPMTIQWAVGSWGPACGPRPANGSQPGGPIHITQNRNELSFSGPGKQYSSGSCWDPHPGLQRVSHAAGTRNWSSLCKSETNGRKATVQTTLTASDDTIRFDETGKFIFNAKDQACTASSRRTRTYRLVQRDPVGETQVAMALDPGPGPSRCKTPGAATALTITSNVALAKAGQRLQLEARGQDSGGCKTQGAIKWALGKTVPGIEIGADDGLLVLSADAPEGDLEVVASSGTALERLRVQVVSKERYEQLLDGERNGVMSTTDGIAGDLASSTVESGVAVAEDRATRRKYWFAALLALTASTLAMVGAVVMRQVRHGHPSRDNAPGEDQQKTAGHDAATQRLERKICPTCGSMYGTEAGFCGKDGSFLVQAN